VQPFERQLLEVLVAFRMSARLEDPADRRHPAALQIEQQLRALVRYAVLAPSTRNSQPWQFTIERNTVRLWADPSRRLPVADPDGRELHLSLGCALENLLVAGTLLGYRREVACFPDLGAPELAAVIGFHPSFRTPSAHGPTLETLQLRHTAHRPFLAREVSQPSLERLRSVAGEPGVRFALCERADRRRSADVLSVRAVATLFGDDAYRMELLGGKRDGTPFLSGQAGSLIFSHAEPARRLAQQVSAGIRSAPVVGVIGSVGDSPVDQLRSGRVLERLWLAATAEGLAMQPIGYALAAPATREALAALFPEAGPRAQQLVRVGYAVARDGAPSARRPLDEVLSIREEVPSREA
jgi:nitroreductase